MEAAAVARAAAARGVRFAAVKAISDEVGFSLPGMSHPGMNQRTGFIDSSGEFQTGRFARFIMIRPWTWAAALRLARNSNRAALALSAWLADKNRESLNSPADEVPENDLPENKMTEKDAEPGSLKISTRL